MSYFATWESSLRPGYRFDYCEGRLHLTVEVVSVDGTCVVLRGVDDRFTRRPAPTRPFEIAFRRGEEPTFLWHVHPEGFLAEAPRR